MFAKIWFIFCALLGLFVIVPILNTVILTWTKEGGILDDMDAELTPMENAVAQMYVPIMAIFLVIIIIYVLSKGRGSGGGQGGGSGGGE